MKIRVTVMTENDKHTTRPVDEVYQYAVAAWKLIADGLMEIAEDPSEKMTVESVEVVEK